MKCINCGRDNKLKDRKANNGLCYYCRHPFAFEPTEMTGKAKFTDTFFAKLLTDISGENTLFFTSKQCQYFLHKKLKQLKRKPNYFGCTMILTILLFIVVNILVFNLVNIWFFVSVGSSLYKIIGELAFPLASWIINLVFVLFIYKLFIHKNTISEDYNYQSCKFYSRLLMILGIFILVIGIFFSIKLWKSFLFFTLFTLLGMGSIYLGLINLINIPTSQPQIIIASQNQVNKWLNRWQEINGSLYYLLSSPNTERFSPVNLGTNSYSFDRVIVCDKPEIVQFMIRNNFHFENNCAVLSIDGYPQSIFNTVIEMLKRNPDLQVYGLHDASPKGVSLIHELRNNEQWFKDSSVNIYDLGISPKQILKNPKYVILNSRESAIEAHLLPQEVKNNLTREELTWLKSGNFVELESFSPKILLQIITRGIILSALPNGDESFIPLEDNNNLGTTGVYLYGIDSFG